ncbi:extracellular solute-binding protein [Halomicrococcus sp. NG-SE-24]|uniref:extracellular solute-binding protein n=1 Tax=Halomicrococcus sp. NG-SE-24 TaxID=3436928 RepID=UPI003D99C310
MREQRTRRRFLAGVGSLGAVGLAGCVSSQDGGGDDTTDGGTDTTDGGSSGADSMTVFHAGSLEPPFGAAEPKFEEKYGVSVSREAKGSVASTKKITEQGRSADVLGVSDFRLIRDRLLPKHGDWYAIFATNAMSIQYREDSPGADDISTDNWWEVLSRDDVTVGHSDPAIDPGGYRAVMTMQLGTEEFDGSRLYDESTYRKLRDNSTVPTGTETNLEGQLEAGALDYAFYYQSISTSTDLPYVELQPEVDLSRATERYAKHYAKAKVTTDGETFTGAPIAYGVTVPGNAEAPDLGAKWVEYMITEPGRKILKSKGLQPVEPAVTAATDAVPERVANHAKEKSSLGPMKV